MPRSRAHARAACAACTCQPGRSGRRGAGVARVRRAGTGDITRYAAQDAAYRMPRFA